MTSLTAKNFKTLLTIKGRHRDTIGEVKGLHLVVKNQNNASWQLRYVIDGKERWHGLGSARLFTLSEARIRGRLARQKLYDDIDPIEAKRSAKVAAAKVARQSTSFEDAALAFHKLKESEWSPRQADQFLSSMRDYVFPIFGKLPVADIDIDLVLRVFEQPHDAGGRFWDARRETASRVRQRIEKVLELSENRHWRSSPNPARWSGNLSAHLPTGGREVKHFAALPYTEAAAFVAKLRTIHGPAARALEFAVLNGSRTNEIIGALWSEIDSEKRIWTIPAERMKMGKEHRVPLSDGAIALLRSLPREDDNPYLFTGTKQGAPLEPRAMYRFLMKLGMNGIVTVHGFRSTFSNWAHETTSGYSEAVIEMALAHKDKNKTKKAYHREDLLEKRRPLMADWSKYCTTPRIITNEVVQLRAKR